MRPWERYVRRAVPYVPGEQPRGERLIKLNTNENPYPPAPGVAEALRGMDAEEFRRYPDPEAGALRDVIADYHGRTREEVFAGVGSDDVLAMAFLTFFNSGKPVLFPDVTYSFYPVWADLFGIPWESPALDGSFRLDPRGYDRDCGGVVFPNPNAPTGLYLPPEQVEEIVRRHPDAVVIVDEAYIDFGGVSVENLLDRYENLLVVRTFSKSRSMAGVRIGYALGSRALIRAMENVRFSYNSYTMNLPSIVLGTAAMRDEAYFRGITGKIVETRERAKARFAALGFEFPDSAANFLLVRHPDVPAARLFEALRERRIYVRYFDRPRISDYLRVTIGTEEEMEALFSFLESYLRGERGQGKRAADRVGVPKGCSPGRADGPAERSPGHADVTAERSPGRADGAGGPECGPSEEGRKRAE